ncbi:hypothetical protein BZM27_22840 [Paraburkholderia steynii]|uniref:Uncharacterized protein n=1 Tax=Paraburkholderia steynii TaxID=1245441 RepID=A0A4R0XI44_9BURK|nr:hypothetical protein BZM27_22840 [Paraburkholderia steynii]
MPHSFIRRTARALITSAALVSALTGCATNHFVNVTPQPVAAPRESAALVDAHVAESALEAGDTQLAISLFEKMLKADPQSMAAQLGLADAMYQSGDFARAGMLYTRVASATPDDARAQLGLARVALRQRRLDEAESRYRKLVDSHPDNPIAAEGLGATLDLQGRHAQAQEVYRAALKQHPEVEGLKADLGLSLVLSDKVRAGANLLLDVVGLPGAPMQARQNLALAYGLLGNNDAARRILVADMSADYAEDNLRFYQNIRERFVTRAGGASAQTSAVPSAAAAFSEGAK